MTPPKLLERLWNIADRVGAAEGIDPVYALDPVGLILQRPLARVDLDLIPNNSITFAKTPNGSPLYGVLLLPDCPPDDLPVVMTEPGGYPNNFVIAENLKEFLGLGYHVGWGDFEMLVYYRDEAVRHFAAPDPEEEDDHEDWKEYLDKKKRLLEALRSELQIEYVPLSLKRMAELQDKYGDLMDAPDVKERLTFGVRVQPEG